MIKPRIKKIAVRTWSCACERVIRKGSSWRQAYDRWLLASIKDAMGTAAPAVRPTLTVSKNSAVKKPKGRATKKKSKRRPASAPKRVNKSVNNLRSEMSLAPAARPRKIIVDQIAPGVLVHRMEDQETAHAHLSVGEGRLPPKLNRPPPVPYEGIPASTRTATPRPAYKPPTSLLLAGARAAAHQPHLISISNSKALESNV